MTAKDFERAFTFKQLQAYNTEIRSKYNDLKFEYNLLVKHQESIIAKEVEIRTKELNDEIKDKDKQIKALKETIIKMQIKQDIDSTNSGLPTSKTPIGKKKYIPNSREKTGKKIGGQEGHKKHKLPKFSEEEITQTIEITPTECNKCHSQNLETLTTSVDKQELDYEVKVVKRNNKFMNCRCKDCGNEFHAKIPNDLKEEIQYGKTVQALAVCLTNEIYTPFNKTVKLISGLTNKEINMSEGYVTKLQKKAASKLEKFIDELKKYIPKQEVYGWDDAVVDINTKEGILRTYCTDNVALFIGHESKNEEGLNEDGILLNTTQNTIVMHDHIIHNYNSKYKFENVECLIHLIRRIKKMKNKTNHEWCDELIQLLSKTNSDRNKLLKEKVDSFDDNYLKELNMKYENIIAKAKKINQEEDIIKNIFKDDECRFIEDLVKYKQNYLLWAYNFSLPSTNNNSERNLRPAKSKLKISGHFKNIKYLQYYATIRSYIETCKKNGINIVDACVRLLCDKPYTLDEILPKEKEDDNLDN